MSALDDVLARLHGVRESGAGFVAQCPAHEDRHQSLSVGAGQDRAVVFNCHACRAAGDAIVIALGLDPREILGARRNGDVVPFRASRSETRRPAVTSRTVYRVEGYEHVRLELEDGSKAFVWRHEGRNGLPDGVRGEDLLYGAEQLDELADGVTVVLCEGEKASDALRAAGIAAVATVTGAAGTPSATSLERLTRFDVVLWADNDAPGLGHMQRTADRLVGLGTTPRWVVWQHAPAKGDAADAPPEERARLVSEAGTYRPEIHSSGTTIFKPDERINLFRSAREITAQTPATPRWILAGYIAAGAITEPDGKLKASGKTTFMLAAIAKIVEGRPFLGRATIASGVILLTEQNSTSLAVALGRAGLSDRDDVQVMFWSDARGLTWPAIVQLAADEARSRGYQLVIVDTLPQFAGISGDGENSSGAALEAMRPIQEAAATGLGFLISRHERKGGGEVGESARGSSAFSGGGRHRAVAAPERRPGRRYGQDDSSPEPLRRNAGRARDRPRQWRVRRSRDRPRCPAEPCARRRTRGPSHQRRPGGRQRRDRRGASRGADQAHDDSRNLESRRRGRHRPAERNGQEGQPIPLLEVSRNSFVRNYRCPGRINS